MVKSPVVVLLFALFAVPARSQQVAPADLRAAIIERSAPRGRAGNPGQQRRRGRQRAQEKVPNEATVCCFGICALSGRCARNYRRSRTVVDIALASSASAIGLATSPRSWGPSLHCRRSGPPGLLRPIRPHGTGHPCARFPDAPPCSHRSLSVRAKLDVHCGRALGLYIGHARRSFAEEVSPFLRWAHSGGGFGSRAPDRNSP
jgi:hypothetical protein